jgi:fatty acid desaturase
MGEGQVRADVRRGVEWPTWALGAGIYGGWILLTYHWAALPLWLFAPLTALVLCWHSSFQHEVIHGHPTRNARINWALGYPPLMLWLPFEDYRVSHLTHHRDSRLTDPLDDPESRYHTPEQWAAAGPLKRAALRYNATMVGRLTLGPFWMIGGYLNGQAGLAIRGEGKTRRIWGMHLIGVAVVCAWLTVICQMPLWIYFLCCVAPGSALMMIRSFAEHRAAAAVRHRTAVVEDFGPLAWLFLFNNLHAAHHLRPGLAWYRLPGWYRAHKSELLAENGGLFYDGYGTVIRRFWNRPHDTPVHPLGRV